MSILTLILLLQFDTKNLCDSLIVYDKACYEEVFECALDGEDVVWCFKEYLNENNS